MPLSAAARLVSHMVIVLFACICLGKAATAQEKILNYHSIIALQKSGAMTVIENIRIQAEGKEIRHGIYRDIPLTFRDSAGKTHAVGFTLVSVKRNGRDEPYSTNRTTKGIRIQIGSADILLNRGIYQYEITYRTDRQIRYFDAYDELSWNVTGTRWVFPIEAAAATVVLPNGVAPAALSYQTGAFGSKETNARVEQHGNRLLFITTRPLGVAQGLTVNVKLPKQALDAPTNAQLAYWYFDDNRNMIIIGTGFLLVMLYYLWGWNKVGRDPPRGVLVPRWDPPAGISPALVNYIDNKGFSGDAWTALSASALNLAVKGLITLEDLETGLRLKRTAKPLSGKLPDGENVIMGELRLTDRSFRIDKSNGEAVKELGTRFRSSIESEHRGEFYRDNRFYTGFGLFLSLASLACLVFFGRLDDAALMTLLLSIGLSLAISGFAIVVGHSVIARGSIVRKMLAILFLAGVALVFLLLFGGSITALIVVVEHQSDPFFLSGTTGILLANILFYYLMGAPTPLGAKMQDGIDGLRQYMTLAEAERLNLAGVPQMSPQHFETLLPYAVALGVEKPWSSLFQNWLASASAGAAASSYTPLWYGGHSYNSHDFTERMADFSGSIANSLESSLPDPPVSSVSSFSGGGGSSGGGGGGGGGGGW